MKTVYTSIFKAQVVLELLKEEKSLTQLAAAYKVHPNVLHEWRTAAVKNLASLFEKGDDIAKLRSTYEQQLEDRYAQIGRLTTQLAWIKKIWPRPGQARSGERWSKWASLTSRSPPRPTS